MTRSTAIRTLFCFTLIASPLFASPLAAAPAPTVLASEIKTFKVVLSKSDKGSNREVYIQAKDSSQAREIAKDQNPGWQVEMVSEVKK